MARSRTMRRRRRGITENQTAEDFLVLNAEDLETQKVAGHVFPSGSRSQAQVYWFSPRRPVKQGAFVHGESIFFRAKEGRAAGAGDASERDFRSQARTTWRTCLPPCARRVWLA